jgi:flagellar hook protein FlgE
MSFNTALSGLNSAQADINVTSNNIANVNTTGFKQSRAEFADVYAVSAFGNNDTAIGAGSVLKSVAQQFKQGNVEFTDNTLDLAVSGEGFFALAPDATSGEVIYTRAGEFSVDKDGYVVNSSGQLLRVFDVNDDGSPKEISMTTTIPLKVDSSTGQPQATSTVSLAANLPSNATGKELDDFDPTISSTYTNSTSITSYDSFGNPVVLTAYYIKDDDNANTWEARIYSNDTAATGLPQTITMTFNTDGSLATPTAPTSLSLAGLSSGAADMSFTLDVAGSTQYSSDFSVTNNQQDGFPTGRLTGLDISDTGLIQANYSNGQSKPLGKVALGYFSNPQGLQQVSNTQWQETVDSGSVIAGEAGTGSFGLIQSGALESSNIDLTKELVGLITAQRNFQANSKSIETNNAITQTIINIR